MVKERCESHTAGGTPCQYIMDDPVTLLTYVPTFFYFDTILLSLSLKLNDLLFYLLFFKVHHLQPYRDREREVGELPT